MRTYLILADPLFKGYAIDTGNKIYAQAKLCDIDLEGNCDSQRLDLSLSTDDVLVTDFDEDDSEWRYLGNLWDLNNSFIPVTVT